MMQEGFPSQFTRSRIAPGTRLNGIYEIDQLIAAGGMGEVYKGHAIQTGDPVAIKVIRSDLAENEAAFALFRKEASALHHLHHDAIVRYYVFTVEPVLQRAYLAMEFVEGRSLSDLLRHGPLTVEAVTSLTQRLAAGLQAAHERGIIHRDVSPDNVIIPSGDVGRAKIIDFGIARTNLLGGGTVIGAGFAGKYNYVSPEQLGLFGGNVTAKSDMYSLGLLLVEALTGQPIDMGGSQVEVIEKRRKLPDLGGIDLRVRPLIERLLQSDPAGRPESMLAVAAWRFGRPDPRRRRDASQPYASRDGRSADARRADGGRRRMWIALGGLLGATALGGAGFLIYTYMLQPGPAATTPGPPSLQPGLANLTPTPNEPARPAPSLTPALSPSGPGNTAVVSPLPRPPPGPITMLPPSVSDAPNVPSVGPPVFDSPPLVTQPPVGPGPKGGRVEQLTRYINQYDGGECFFITPTAVTDNAATIEGFGGSVAPFQTLNDAFRRTNGFEANIGLRQVTAAQCPAVTFLSRLRSSQFAAPRLHIADISLRTGDALNGTIETVGTRHIELLLVSDDGSVQNVTSAIRPGTNPRAFSLRAQSATGPGQPQLLVAVATPQPLQALKAITPISADQLFPTVLAEGARMGQTLSATARYFKVDR